MLERKEREQPPPSTAADEGAAVVEDGGSDSDDDDKMATKAAPRKATKPGASKLTKPKGKVSKRAVLEAAGALAPTTGAKRGGTASSSLKAFRKPRADPEAVERGCLLRPADDKTTAGAASAWVDLANLFGEGSPRTTSLPSCAPRSADARLMTPTARSRCSRRSALCRAFGS